MTGPDGGALVVVGSANLDLVASVARLPEPGETVLADGVEHRVGGKGLNQAVAASRAGAATSLLAAVGRDQAASRLMAVADDAGVDVGLVRRVGRPTGTAWVTVQPDGENVIVVDPGANAALIDLNRDEREALGKAGVVLLQLEIPLPTVAQVVVGAKAGGAIVVLNAAPALQLDPGVLDAVQVLIVNQHEARELGDAGHRASALVITLGADGALIRASGDERRVPGLPAQVVDTTGAGDTFAGYLAAALARGESLDRSVALGVAAGALAVERAGAAASVPSSAEVQARLAGVR